MKLLDHLTNSFSNIRHIESSKFLLAVSGGVDSMVLVDLFKSKELNFSVAHCNFQLRGADSDLDEELVTAICEKNSIPLFKTTFDTQGLLDNTNKSLQMLARELRYNWFNELRQKHNFDYVVTAHHLNDQIETFFINLSRGSGLNGLKGINEFNNYLYRPLLSITKDQIRRYATVNKIDFREDVSNSSNKYKRNLIRNKIAPLFKELNPSFEETMLTNLSMIDRSEQFMAKTIEKNLSRGIIKTVGDTVKLNKKLLVELSFITEHLYHYLKAFDFTYSQVLVITNFITNNTQPGKIIHAKNHKLLNDREELLLYPIKKDDIIPVEIKKDVKSVTNPVSLTFDILPINRVKILPQANKAYIDADKLTWPLTIRKWKQGDVFYPLGMTNKKKLSDFLINEKVNLVEKEKVLVLESNNEICWVINHRLSNKFKITDNTRQVLLITKN